MQPSAARHSAKSSLCEWAFPHSVWADVSFEMKENSLNFHVNKSWHLNANMLDNM